ncbi:MAG: MBL fold metallo-hydrolase [Desulfobacterales bacterium]|jgi:7,8-dihydropterin-6-yl-methyl-4-(beta-D-ribofuranosyl)aminobenzene 5'-phosphate synthase
MKRAFFYKILLGLMIVPAWNLILFSPSMRASAMKPAFKGTTSVTAKNLRIIVVYDNNPYKAGLTTAWGFACVIKGAEKTILFDTGGSSALLLDNMQQLGIDPKEIDIVVLSHIHGDHVGGLDGFLRQNSKVAVYLPATFPLELKESLTRVGVKMIEVNDPVMICSGVYSTGVLGSWIKEQALMISTKTGIIVITGCAHPGIVNILKVAKELIEDKILLVMGGFHLGAESKPNLEEIISDFSKMGVERVGPCHCSGDPARRMFKQAYGNGYMNVGVGRLIELP